MDAEREELKAGISRRRFMRDAGTTAAGVAIAAAGAETFFTDVANSAAESRPVAEIDPRGLLEAKPLQGDILVGSIVSTRKRALVVIPPVSSPVTVSLTPNARVWREGDTSLSAYSVGEEVVLLGERRGNRFTAVSVASVFRTIVTTVYSRTGRRLHTTQGDVVITPHTVAQGGTVPSGSSCSGEPFLPTPLNELKAGYEIMVRGRLNKKQEMMASAIGARPNSPVALP
jgi:hypothetical protein